MKGHMTAWLHLPGSGRWVNRNGSIPRANEQAGPANAGERSITNFCLVKW